TPPNDGTQKGNKLDLRLALKKGAGQAPCSTVAPSSDKAEVLQWLSGLNGARGRHHSIREDQ
ncbi:hypothetical protein KZZ07_26480, partial [Mameliella sp. CS4]|uniref:hypothetical protein n=1 Tax=Mameliella sp. CS4 TaxID=2862329 RepID=UPI001C5CF305